MSWSCFHVAMFSSAHSRPQFKFGNVAPTSGTIGTDWYEIGAVLFRWGPQLLSFD